MAAVANVNIWRAKEGRAQDFIAKVATAKKIHERLGGRVRVWQTAIGGRAQTIGYVVEHASWEEFGKFGAAMEGDNEWQQFWADALLDPTAEILESSVIAEIPGL